jgi:hypothetical protein
VVLRRSQLPIIAYRQRAAKAYVGVRGLIKLRQRRVIPSAARDLLFSGRQFLELTHSPST